MATTTITTSTGDDLIMAQAVGYDLALGQNANAAQIKAQLVKVWTSYIQGVQRNMQQAALTPPTPIVPT